MSAYQPSFGNKLIRLLQKSLVSGFVVCSFLAYAFHERFMTADSGAALSQQAEGSLRSDQAQALPEATPTLEQFVQSDPPTVAARAATAKPTATVSARSAPRATSTPLPTAVALAKPSGAYKDGSYTGSRVNAYWGWVQIKAVVQNGKIADVQFLQYPNDRRTSQFINSQAIPYLQSETIRAQNANVDIITGATLTSEAFIRSLQAALNTAKN